MTLTRRETLAETLTMNLEMHDDGGSSDTVQVELDDTTDLTAADRATIREECEDWARGGDWGAEGALVDVYWTLRREDGEEVASDCHEVEIEPDHDALIRAAGGDADCEHEWTREGEGGCDENPGVWSLGGTTFAYASHCVRCGLRKRETHYGSQRNPGQHDEVRYEMPEADDGR